MERNPTNPLNPDLSHICLPTLLGWQERTDRLWTNSEHEHLGIKGTAKVERRVRQKTPLSVHKVGGPTTNHIQTIAGGVPGTLVTTVLSFRATHRHVTFLTDQFVHRATCSLKKETSSWQSLQIMFCFPLYNLHHEKPSICQSWSHHFSGRTETGKMSTATGLV